MAHFVYIYRSNLRKIGQKLEFLCQLRSQRRLCSSAVNDRHPDSSHTTRKARPGVAGKFPPDQLSDSLTDAEKTIEQVVRSEDSNDFFGFEGGTVNTGHVESVKAKDALEKYSHLFHRGPDEELRLERVYATGFGNIRYDRDNPALYRSNNSTAATPLVNETDLSNANEESSKTSFIDEQYFSDYLAGALEATRQTRQNEYEKTSATPRAEDSITSDAMKLDTESTINNVDERYFTSYNAGAKNMTESVDRATTDSKENLASSNWKEADTVPANFIDEQYFGSYMAGAKNMAEAIGQATTDSKENFFPSKPEVAETESAEFIDKQYFGAYLSGARTNKLDPPKTRMPIPESPNVDNQKFKSAIFSDLNKSNGPDFFGTTEKRHAETKENDKLSAKSVPGQGGDVPDEAVERSTRNAEKYRQRLAGVDTENPKTAYDFVMKQRLQQQQHGEGPDKGKGPKLDSHGFKVLSNQTHDLENEPEMVVLQILKESILYDDNGIVALSKPYGLVCHGGAGHRHHVDKFLPDLAKYVSRSGRPPCEQLHLVHRLDRDTTGVLLLARTPLMAQLLHSLLARHLIVKTYWALTKRVPDQPEGIINIPMAEAVVEGAARMVLRPVLDRDTRLVLRRDGEARSHRAVTAYRVLSSKDSAALVELKPETGVRHQLRVHLAYGLGCPVLGDHKYSHLSVGAPQRLPADMLNKLGVRQSKVRHLAMHLHARGVSIPEVLDGRDIVIGARLPSHFAKNMRALRIREP